MLNHFEVLKNYFIAAIRAIRRSPWGALVKILAIAAGVCTSVIHIGLYFSEDFSDYRELWPGLILILLSAVLLIQFYGRPQTRKEYKVRIMLGDEDLRMRGRNITEAALVILGGVVLGLVISDSYFTYWQALSFEFTYSEYLLGILILGFGHFTIFLFTVWFGSAFAIRNNSQNFSRFSKSLAGSLIFITSLAAIFWSMNYQGFSNLVNIRLIDIIALSFFSYSSWNRLAQYTLESKDRQFTFLKTQNSANLKIFIYWLYQVGPPALISVGLSLLIGKVYLLLEPLNNSSLSHLITICWTAFISIIIILGLSQAFIRGFEQETNGYIKSDTD